MIATPLIGLALLWPLFGGPGSEDLFIRLAGFELSLARVDKLSLAFGTIFCIAATLAAIYALDHA